MRANSLFSILVLFAAGLPGCLDASVPPRFRGVPRDAAGADLAAPPPCRPVLTGEPIVNEVLARPGGFDIDGDQLSNGRDEALELIHDSAYDAHYDGVQLWQASKLRGTIRSHQCMPPGQMLVVTGPTTRELTLPPGATQLRLDHAMSLADGAGPLILRGLAGTVVAEVALPAALDATATSLARTVDGDRFAPWGWHCLLPETGEQPASLGRCLDGQPPCTCIEALKPLCDRELPVGAVPET